MDKFPDVLLANEKARDYKSYYFRVSLAIGRDGYIKHIGAKAFGIFLVICCYMDKNKTAFPSLKTIASQSGCSVRTTQKEIEWLVECGWMEKLGRVKVKGGRFGNTKYQILQDDIIRSFGQESFLNQPVANSADG